MSKQLYLGTADERLSPSLSFHCLIFPYSKMVPIYCLDDRETFTVVAPYGDFLHNNRAALTYRLWRLSEHWKFVLKLCTKKITTKPAAAKQDLSTSESCMIRARRFRICYDLWYLSKIKQNDEGVLFPWQQPKASIQHFHNLMK